MDERRKADVLRMPPHHSDNSKKIRTHVIGGWAETKEVVCEAKGGNCQWTIAAVRCARPNRLAPEVTDHQIALTRAHINTHTLTHKHTNI